MHGRHRGDSGMHWMESFGNGYGTIWMILFWILLVVIAVYLIAKIIKNSNKKKPVGPKEEKLDNAPLQILQERLAKGEMDEVEYERLKDIIRRDNE